MTLGTVSTARGQANGTITSPAQGTVNVHTVVNKTVVNGISYLKVTATAPINGYKLKSAFFSDGLSGNQISRTETWNTIPGSTDQYALIPIGTTGYIGVRVGIGLFNNNTGMGDTITNFFIDINQ